MLGQGAQAGPEKSCNANNLRQIVVAQEQLGLEQRIERRSVPRQVSSHAALCWGFALGEGALASLMMLVPALVYHAVLMQVPLEQVPFWLYGIYSHGGRGDLRRLLGGVGRQVPQPRRAAAQHGRRRGAGVDRRLRHRAVSRLSRRARGRPVARLADLGLYRGRAGAAVRAQHRLCRAGRAHPRRPAAIPEGLGDRRARRRGALPAQWQPLEIRLSAGRHALCRRVLDGRVPSAAIVEFAQAWLARGSENMVFVGELGDVDGLERIVGELKRFAINVGVCPGHQQYQLQVPRRGADRPEQLAALPQKADERRRGAAGSGCSTSPAPPSGWCCWRRCCWLSPS